MGEYLGELFKGDFHRESQERCAFCVRYYPIVATQSVQACWHAISNISLQWLNHCTMKLIVR